MDLTISALSPDDWQAVSAIYEEGINTGQATFETVLPTWEKWNSARRPDCRLIARRQAEIVGWAALSPVSSRPAYAGVAEVSVYVAGRARGQGVGRHLLNALIADADKSGIWTLQATMFPENEASIGLHKACGFRTVGFRERIAELHGVWRNTILMERRSQLMGQ